MNRSEVAKLCSELEREHGLEPGLLLSRSRQGKVSRVRRLAYERLYALGMSCNEIGAAFGRHHTSVMEVLKGKRRAA